MKKIQLCNIYNEAIELHEVKDHISFETHVILWDGFFGRWIPSERKHFHEKTITKVLNEDRLEKESR